MTTPMVHRFEPDPNGGIRHTDLRTGKVRTLTNMPAENGSSRRGNIARQLRSMTATVTPAPAVARTATPTNTTSTTASTARLARIGIR